MAGTAKLSYDNIISYITSFKSFGFEVLETLKSKTTEAHTFFPVFLSGMSSVFRSCMIGSVLFPIIVWSMSRCLFVSFLSIDEDNKRISSRNLKDGMRLLSTPYPVRGDVIAPFIGSFFYNLIATRE